MGVFFDEMKRTMNWVAEQPKVIFLGQAVGVPGTFMYGSIEDVPVERRLEMPVSESFQMQLSVGLAFSGYTPISIFPRLNFLTLAMGDLSNIVEKLPDLSPQSYPKIIVRSAIGPDRPVHPGHQHIGDMTEGFRALLPNMDVVRIEHPQDIMPAYKKALDPNNPKSSLIIEVGNAYQG